MPLISSARTSARQAALRQFRNRIEANPALTRSHVSYQANRNRTRYRWFKYKEGFSATLVEYLIAHSGVSDGVIFDPFAGTGATLFAARDLGIRGVGIELLPVGAAVIAARDAADRVDIEEFRRIIRAIRKKEWTSCRGRRKPFSHLRITKGAFSEQTETSIEAFVGWTESRSDSVEIRNLLRLACMSILEEVSFTRKDGQYLRWDYRAPRKLPGKQFSKGPIAAFDVAINRKLNQMAEDLGHRDLFDAAPNASPEKIELQEGSCLSLLPGIQQDSIDLLITSPPYCNRYDYTRTYALELAFLGVDEDRLKCLRQDLLSCTVENREKTDALRRQYGDLGEMARFDAAMDAFQSNRALHEVLAILDAKAAAKELNNTNVARMVRNYFLESSFAIHEWFRVMAPGSRVYVVNDNVRYSGEEVPVDLILCAFAEHAGFDVERIWVLERGKGNSSQQMGEHGRSELRKCIYVWRKP